MNSFKVLFDNGSEQIISGEYKSAVLYGITRLEQTPILPCLGIKLIVDENSEVLWPASEVIKRRMNLTVGQNVDTQLQQPDPSADGPNE